MSSSLFTFLLSFALLSIMGWIILYMGVRSRREARLREDTEHTRTTGVIVDHVRKVIRTGRSGGSHVFWKPVIEFSAEGQDYHLEYGNIMNREKYTRRKNSRHSLRCQRPYSLSLGRGSHVSPAWRRCTDRHHMDHRKRYLCVCRRDGGLWRTYRFRTSVAEYCGHIP